MGLSKGETPYLKFDKGVVTLTSTNPTATVSVKLNVPENFTPSLSSYSVIASGVPSVYTVTKNGPLTGDPVVGITQSLIFTRKNLQGNYYVEDYPATITFSYPGGSVTDYLSVLVS